MPEYIIDLPVELIEIIEAEGYSVEDYIQTMLIKPLSDRLMVKLEKTVVEKKRKTIDTTAKEITDKILVKEKQEEVDKPAIEEDGEIK